MITALLISWVFMTLMLSGWVIKYLRRQAKQKKKDNRKLLKD